METAIDAHFGFDGDEIVSNTSLIDFEGVVSWPIDNYVRNTDIYNDNCTYQIQN